MATRSIHTAEKCRQRSIATLAELKIRTWSLRETSCSHKIFKMIWTLNFFFSNSNHVISKRLYNKYIRITLKVMTLYIVCKNECMFGMFVWKICILNSNQSFPFKLQNFFLTQQTSTLAHNEFSWLNIIGMTFSQ